MIYHLQYLNKCLVHLKTEEINENTRLFDKDTGILGYFCVSMLSEGTTFGEKGLDDSTPRNATIVCINDCFFCCVLKRDYDKYIKDLNRGQMNKIRDFFFSQVFKKAVPRNLTDNLGSDFSKLTMIYKKGDILYHQGSVEDNGRLYIVKEGSVIVDKQVVGDSQPHSDLMVRQRQSHTYFLCKMSEGEIIGEECLFTADPASYTIRVASQTASLYYTSKQTLKSYLSKSGVLLDFLRELYKSRIESRKFLLDQLISRDRRLKGVTTVRGPIIRNKGAKVDTWRKKKPLAELELETIEEFDLKYHSKHADFVRKIAPSRDRHFLMLKDFEGVSSALPIIKKEKSKIDSIDKEDYLLRDNSMAELNKVRMKLKDPRHLVKLKEGIFRRAISVGGYQNKNLDSSSISISINYPRSVDYALRNSKKDGNENITFGILPPLHKKSKDHTLSSIENKAPSNHTSITNIKSSNTIFRSYDDRRPSSFRHDIRSTLIRGDIGMTAKLISKLKRVK